MRFICEPVLKAADASQNQNSQVIDASQLFKGSAQAVVTGTAAGTLKVQVSNDNYIPAKAPPTHWNDLSGSSVAIAGAGNYLIPQVDLCYQWLRLVFTNTSGTGTITANFKGNGF